MIYGGTYATYKRATGEVTGWIHDCTRHVLQSLQTSKSEAFQKHAKLYGRLSSQTPGSQQSSIRHIDEMLNILSDPSNGFSMENCPSLFKKLPSTLSHCVKAIQLRSLTNFFYQRKAPKDRIDPNLQVAQKKHRHFVQVMKVWREKLKNLMRRAEKETENEVSVALVPVFDSFNVDDEVDEQCTSDDDDDEHLQMPSKGDTACTALTIYGMNMEEENLDDFDDIVFIMQCLVVDMNQLMKTVADEWLKVRNGTSNYIQASLATLLAVRRVRKLTEELQAQFPEIQSFEDFVAALYQQEYEADDNKPDWEKGTRMANQFTKYAQDRVYPDGTLFYVMKTVAVTLRSFTSTIPVRKVNLTLKVGYFGPPFDEVCSQVTSFVDFSRFLLEHLPLIYNDFISLGAFFENDGAVNFILLEEVFQDFQAYFEQGSNFKLLTIPFVFLVSAWYHSIQILQGNLMLSRITAVTRQAVRNLTNSLIKCEALHRNSTNGLFYDLSLPKLKYLRDHTTFYRNHPFFAGMIALDIAVNISLFLGVVTIPFTLFTHRMLHLYNAMVRGGGMEPVPMMENFLDIHGKAFFLPTRPSRNFLGAIEKNCHGIDEKTASKLYRVLIEKDMSGLEHSAFPHLVKSVQRIWTKDFYESSLLAFNFMAFEEALVPVVNEVHALVPSQKTWQDCVLLFIGLYDHQIDLPICKPAIRVFSRSIRKIAPVTFDLLPRVSGSMHTALYGPLPSLEYPDEDPPEIHDLFGKVMNIFEDYTGPLRGDEVEYVYKSSRDNPPILGLCDLWADSPEHIMIGIMNHVAAGPRANTELLECLMQIDIHRLRQPLDPMHACAATGNLDNLEVLLSARNYSERDRQCKRHGNTLLHYAAMYGHLKTVKYLERLFVNPNIVNTAGKKPLDLAKTTAIKEELLQYHTLHYEENFRVDSRPVSAARDNERRWAREADRRARGVHEKLNRRRQENQPVRVVTADEDMKAQQAADELLAMEEKEKANGRGSSSSSSGSNGGKGKGKGKRRKRR